MPIADAHTFTQTTCYKYIQRYVNWCYGMKNAGAEDKKTATHSTLFCVTSFSASIKNKTGALSSLFFFHFLVWLNTFCSGTSLCVALFLVRAAEKAEFYSHDSARVWTSGVLMKDSSTSERVAAACQGVCRFPLDRRMHILSLLFLYAAQSHFPACCFLCFAPQWDPEYSNSRRRLPACCCCYCWMAHYEYDFLCFKTQ